MYKPKKASLPSFPSLSFSFNLNNEILGIFEMPMHFIFQSKNKTRKKTPPNPEIINAIAYPKLDSKKNEKKKKEYLKLASSNRPPNS